MPKSSKTSPNQIAMDFEENIEDLEPNIDELTEIDSQILENTLNEIEKEEDLIKVQEKKEEKKKNTNVVKQQKKKNQKSQQEDNWDIPNFNSKPKEQKLDDNSSIKNIDKAIDEPVKKIEAEELKRKREQAVSGNRGKPIGSGVKKERKIKIKEVEDNYKPTFFDQLLTFAFIIIFIAGLVILFNMLYIVLWLGDKAFLFKPILLLLIGYAGLSYYKKSKKGIKIWNKFSTYIARKLQ